MTPDAKRRIVAALLEGYRNCTSTAEQERYHAGVNTLSAALRQESVISPSEAHAISMAAAGLDVIYTPGKDV